MVLIKEFQVLLPMTVEEFQIGQLYAVAEASKEATGGQNAIEILKNEPYDDPIMGKGQYTHKIYHIAGRCPRLIQAIAPKSALKVEERAWNAYPYCKTGERFSLTVESNHLNDNGTTANALNADQHALSKRKIHKIDISKAPSGFECEYDPTKFRSQKAHRGPLHDGWEKNANPIMCCYKLVTIKFKVFGFESRAESMIDQVQSEILVKFYKQVFCLMDKWFGLSMDDIRMMEEATKAELDQKIEGLNLETRDAQKKDRPDQKEDSHHSNIPEPSNKARGQEI